MKCIFLNIFYNGLRCSLLCVLTHFCMGSSTPPEPFNKLIHQGMILAEDNQKMSKSRGNVVNPDVVLAEFGADAFRVYEMFMGPLEDVKPWQTAGLKGTKRFLDRIWNLYQRGVSEEAPSNSLKRALHKTIKKVTDDIEKMRFNTAIAQMMTFLNDASAAEKLPKSMLMDFIRSI